MTVNIRLLSHRAQYAILKLHDSIQTVWDLQIIDSAIIAQNIALHSLNHILSLKNCGPKTTAEIYLFCHLYNHELRFSDGNDVKSNPELMKAIQQLTIGETNKLGMREEKP